MKTTKYTNQFLQETPDSSFHSSIVVADVDICKESGVSFSLKEDSKYVYHYLKLPISFEKDKFSYEAAHLLSFVIHKQDYCKYTRKPKEKWIPVSRNLLYDFFGHKTSPSKYLHELINAGVLQLKSIGLGTYSTDTHICQHVCLTIPYYKDVVGNRFHNIPVKTPRLYTDGKRKKNVRIKKPKETLFQILERNYNGVTVLDSWQTELWNIDSVLENEGSYIHDKTFAKMIHNNDFEIRQSGNGRIYHPVIEMSRKLRKYVRYKNEKVITLDIKACHPFLLAHYANSEDREKWLELCRTDLYNQFVTDEYPREIVKISFQKALSERSSDLCASRIQMMIKNDFPSIWKHLQGKWEIIRKEGKEGNSVQLEMQRLESKIFVDGVLTKLAKKIWLLPMHDGIMVEEHNFQKVKKLIDDVCMKILGYKFIITKQ